VGRGYLRAKFDKEENKKKGAKEKRGKMENRKYL
jgi:hypothetical protein